MKKECTLTNEELIQKIRRWNTKLCMTGGSAWMLKVPADANEDPDLLISEIARRFETLIKEIPA